VAKPVTDAAVFDAALGVLAQYGYAAATTRRIAEAAGVNEVTLFRRYGDKRGLIAAAIHADISQLAADGLSPTGDLQADLIRVVEYYSALYERREGLIGTLILEGARDADMAALISEPLAAMARIGELIAGYQRAGQLLDEPTQYAVQALVAPLLMTAIMRRITSSTVALPTAQSVVQRYLAGHGRAPRKTSKRIVAKSRQGGAASSRDIN
jgi:AcrR family transcriptional regulator